MNDSGLKNWYLPLFIALVILFAAFESAIWKNIFEFLPSPMIWLSVIIYACIVRPPFECLILIYSTSFILQTMTVTPIGFMIFIQTILMIFIKIFKTRIFWEGRSYFIFLNCLSLLIFHLLHLFLSSFFEENPIFHIQAVSWFGEMMTFLILSPIVFGILSFILPLKDSQLDDEGMTVHG